MTVANKSATLSSIVRPPRPISDKDLQEGIRTLMSLGSVERALKLDDSTSYERIKGDAFKEMTTPERIGYLRKVAGWEQPDQKKMVAYLLHVCFEGSTQIAAAKAG
jgi:hypothetical protein